MRKLKLFTAAILLSSATAAMAEPLFLDYGNEYGGVPVWSPKTEQAIVEYFSGQKPFNPNQNLSDSLMASSKSLFPTTQAQRDASPTEINNEFGISTIPLTLDDQTGQSQLQRYFPLPGLHPFLDLSTVTTYRMSPTLQVLDLLGETPEGRALMKVVQTVVRNDGFGLSNKIGVAEHMLDPTGMEPYLAALSWDPDHLAGLDPTSRLRGLFQHARTSLPLIGEVPSQELTLWESVQKWLLDSWYNILPPKAGE